MADSKEKLLKDIANYKSGESSYRNSVSLHDFIHRGKNLSLLPKEYDEEGIEITTNEENADQDIHHALDKMRDIVSSKYKQWGRNLHYKSGAPAQEGGYRKTRRGRKHRKGSRKAHRKHRTRRA